MGPGLIKINENIETKIGSIMNIELHLKGIQSGQFIPSFSNMSRPQRSILVTAINLATQLQPTSNTTNPPSVGSVKELENFLYSSHMEATIQIVNWF